MIIIAVTATNSIAKVCFSWEIAKKKMRFSELDKIQPRSLKLCQKHFVDKKFFQHFLPSFWR